MHHPTSPAVNIGASGALFATPKAAGKGHGAGKQAGGGSESASPHPSAGGNQTSMLQHFRVVKRHKLVEINQNVGNVGFFKHPGAPPAFGGGSKLLPPPPPASPTVTACTLTSLGTEDTVAARAAATAARHTTAAGINYVGRAAAAISGRTAFMFSTPSLATYHHQTAVSLSTAIDAAETTTLVQGGSAVGGNRKRPQWDDDDDEMHDDAASKPWQATCSAVKVHLSATAAATASLLPSGVAMDDSGGCGGRLLMQAPLRQQDQSPRAVDAALPLMSEAVDDRALVSIGADTPTPQQHLRSIFTAAIPDGPGEEGTGGAVTSTANADFCGYYCPLPCETDAEE